MISIRPLLEMMVDLTSQVTERLWFLWQTNRRRVLLCALAALPLMVVATTTLIAAVFLIGPGDRVDNWYLQQGTVALIDKDYEIARLCYTSLLQREPDNPKYRYGLAMSLFGLGRTSEAIRLTRQLAPETGEGYGPAHTFVAQQILATPDPSQEELRAAERHLLRAVASDPADQKTHAMLAAIYARTNRWAQVKEHLPLAGQAVDEIGILAAQSFAAQGDTAEADAWAKRAVMFYRNRSLADLKDYASRFKWAQATVLLRDFPMAMEILDAAYNDSHDPGFRAAQAEVCLAWSRTANLSAAQRLAIIQRGLSMNSQNPGLLMRLVDPAVIEAAGSAQPATSSAEGAIQAIVLAAGAARQDQASEVRRQVGLAVAAGGNDAAAMVANVACLWAYSGQPEAAKALALSTALIELQPGWAVAQRAQGLVLAKQGRYTLAATFLEPATKAMPADIAIHGTLAQCYEHMGMPYEAAEQRRLAQPAAPATTQALPGVK